MLAAPQPETHPSSRPLWQAHSWAAAASGEPTGPGPHRRPPGPARPAAAHLGFRGALSCPAIAAQPAAPASRVLDAETPGPARLPRARRGPWGVGVAGTGGG